MWHQRWSKDFEKPYQSFGGCYNLVVILILFILSCSLAGHWQTQSLCLHKELMKRTLGKPTHAFEARDYVVSSPVAAGHAAMAQPLTPRTGPRLGTQGTWHASTPRNEMPSWETCAGGEESSPVNSTAASSEKLAGEEQQPLIFGFPPFLF